jgi:hypothetical protein
MNDKTIQLIRDFASGITTALDQLAASLGVAAQKVLEILIKQQIVIGIQDLIVCLLILPVLFFVDRGLIRAWKKAEQESRDSKEGLVVVSVLISLGNVGCIIVIICMLTSGIGHLINPGYYALKDVLNMFNGGGK